MALQDNDVQKQIRHMMAFIEQEANEKAEEIETKAEEEFNIEKGRLVQQQRVKIMEHFERKEKHIELQKRVQRSNMLNQARLKLLKAQEEHSNDILEEAERRLATCSENTEKYQKILKGLIHQGLYQLMEPQVILRCRERDVDVIQKILGDVTASYRKETCKDVKVYVDTENFLSKKIAGGIELITLNNKIRLTNTVESRLQLIYHEMIPEIRTKLFGANPNRKFLD